MKPSLHPNAIADAALRVADRFGLERVTMRRVARELEVAPMSLYRHVRNKSDLLDRMLGRVVQRVVPLDAIGAPWPAALRAVAVEARAVLRRHPSWLPLFTRVVAPPAALSLFEQLAVTMTKSRVPAKRKLHQITSLMCFTLGFILVEHMMRGTDGAPVPVAQIRAMRQVTAASPQTFPSLFGLAGALDRWSFDEAFSVGLELLLADLQSSRAA